MSFHVSMVSSMLFLVIGHLTWSPIVSELTVLISQEVRGRNNKANLGLIACMGRLGSNISLYPCISSRSRELWCFLQVQMNGQCQTFSEMLGSVKVSNEVFVSMMLLLFSFEDIYLPFAHRPGMETCGITVPPVLFSIHNAVRICTVVFSGTESPGNQ